MDGDIRRMEYVLCGDRSGIRSVLYGGDCSRMDCLLMVVNARNPNGDISGIKSILGGGCIRMEFLPMIIVTEFYLIVVIAAE